ncbi:MAG: hypothetical protein H6807_07690 [Planctomycetes bacterium]|nr:hypothetical protein [Planctomycetota bacterium]
MADSLEMTLWSLAILGTIIFVLKLAMMFVGMDGHGDGDLDHGGADFGDHGDGDFGDHGDGDFGDHDVSHDHGSEDSTSAFNLLSLQSLACLAMSVGWMGLGMMRSFQSPGWLALTVAAVFGLLMVWFMGFLLRKARRLESSGTLDLRNAVGRSGTVYLGIPKGGVGQVQVVVQGRLATLEARSELDLLPTGTKVLVSSVDPNGTLVVSPA